MPIALLCKKGIVKDSILGFIGFCSLAGAAFYFCNPTVALNSKYIILSMHNYVWHWLMIVTGTFIIVSFDLLKKDTLRMLVGSYTIWFIFAISAAVINNICYTLAPELNIDYYHIGYVKIVYPVLNLIFKYPEPYILFFLIFIVYFALGTIGVYYIAKGVRDLNHKIFKKNEENIANEM